MYSEKYDVTIMIDYIEQIVKCFTVQFVILQDVARQNKDINFQERFSSSD